MRIFLLRNFGEVKGMSRILMIDDEQLIRSLIVEVLTLDGHEVDQAENGDIGLKLVELHPYDLVITDIIMPEMDGIGVIMSLKEKHPQIKTIVLTGGSLINDKDYLINVSRLMKVDLVIPKPFVVDDLRNAVKELLQKQS